MSYKKKQTRIKTTHGVWTISFYSWPIPLNLPLSFSLQFSFFFLWFHQISDAVRYVFRCTALWDSPLGRDIALYKNIFIIILLYHSSPRCPLCCGFRREVGQTYRRAGRLSQWEKQAKRRGTERRRLTQRQRNGEAKREGREGEKKGRQSEICNHIHWLKKINIHSLHTDKLW